MWYISPRGIPSIVCYMPYLQRCQAQRVYHEQARESLLKEKDQYGFPP